MARSVTRRAGQIVTGLASLLALLAVLGGAPIGLAVLGGNPLPDHVPSWAEISGTLLGRDDTGTVFVAAITVVGWLAWAAFALPVVLESVARLRGVRTPRIPGLSTTQTIAAGLVGGVALLIASPALAAVGTAYAGPPNTAAARPAVVVTHTGTPASSGPPALALLPGVPTTPAAAATPHELSVVPVVDRTDLPVYEVARGDWVWYVADRFLGDPERYRDVASLNPEYAAADGRFPNHIEAGWKLRLPADAYDRGARRHATGQLITAPTAQPGTSPTAPVPGAADPPTVTTPTAPSTPTASPTVTSSAAQSGAPTPQSTATAPAAAATDHTTRGDAAADHGDDVGDLVAAAATVGGIGMLATLTLIALRHRRARQQQHRRPRRRIPQPASGDTEAKLRRAAAAADVDRLDTGLRVLAAGLADWPEDQWPDVVAAWLDGDTVHLVLTRPCPNPAPEPWLSDGETVWTLPGHRTLPDVDDQLAPLPTLCAIGAQDRQQLLVDLERLGMLTVAGDPDRAMDLLRYIAGELAHNRWSDDVQVILAGFDQTEAQLLANINPDRVTVAASIAAATTRLARQLTDTRAALRHAGAATAVHGRVTDTVEAWQPTVLLVAQPGPQDTAALAELEQQLTTGASGYAVVATAAADAPYGRWPVTVTADKQLRVAFLTESPLTASSLSSELLPPLADLTRAAALHGDAPTPLAPDIEAWAHGTDAAGGLRDLLDIDEAVDDEEGTQSEVTAAPSLPVKLTISTDARAVGPGRDAVTDPVLLPLRRATADPQAGAARRRDREARDPNLDSDVAAWFDADSTRPRIGILGPVQIEAPGTPPSNRLRFHGEIIVYLAARGARGATAVQLEDALWREQEASSSNRRSLISRARRWLGDKPDGSKWMPAMHAGDQLYRVDDGVLLDWALFRRLRARGESRDDDGVTDLHRALELVRGAPFDGAQDAYTAERVPYAWLPDSEIAPTHVVAAVVDTAHQLVELYLTAADLPKARWALERAWLADPDRHEDQPWRDAMRIAHADGRDSELKALIQNLLVHRDVEVPEDLDPETYRIVQRFMPYLRTAS